MNYSSLEDAYGTPFGQRVPVTHQRKDIKDAPIAQAEFTSLAKKGEESIKKNQSLVDSIQASLPLDRNPATESFVVETDKPTPVKRMEVREKFTTPTTVSSTDEDKISRILRLIEQNRTGYERPATQDMVLYVFTGVFFLFTLDTFVLLGKSMRKH